ncbi:LGFP repeat-containing protein [Mycobacterium sp.]|uniref:LGFP repeat-containing protein n=1 Tax=Mycobacterium sp. TaxID=1785 RepID=UPI003BB113FD
MTRQQARSGAVARAARGLAVLAAGFTCMALLTPVAAASPIGDADNAITAAWKDAGGDTSDLGAKQGDCYVAGQGFAQDFVHGKMFFTPATGPRLMMGAILDKYEALGGPAASDLGFPTANEVRGLAGPDSRVSTFSASDKPLIYWTADHGAFVVRGAINAAWDKLGSSSGALGVPTGDETFDGELATQAFSGGKVSWNRLTKAFTTVPPDLAGKLTDLQVPVDPTADINMAWRAAGGPSGPLGAKQGDQYPAGSDGLAQNFAGGKIFFSPATGANAIEADILSKYESLGGPGGDLGFPISNETAGGLKSASKISAFSATDKPVIFWTPDHGAFVVRGAIKAAWDKLLGATGKLGAPVADQTVNKDVVTQKFTGGEIAWNKTKNTFTTQPAILASALSGLQVPGQKTPSGAAPSGGGMSWLSGHWWWLLAGVAGLLLIGLLVPSARVWRRRRAVKRENKTLRVAEPDESAYEPPTESVAQWSPDDDAELASSNLSDEHRPPRPRTVRLPSQPGSQWMPPSRKSLVDELLEDEPESPDELSGFADFDRDVHEDLHEDLHDDLHDDLHEDHHQDPDDVDTAPTGIPVAGDVRAGDVRTGDVRAGRHAAAGGDDAQVTEAVPIPRIASGQLAIHLPMDDPYQVPDGYPVKANASSGLYYMPASALYEETMAEIWFASEEIAQANGFHRAG